MKIELPFPPSELSGHNNGQWRGKSGTVRKYREGAKAAVHGRAGRDGLLRYLVSYRDHDDFHEHCVERIFVDVWRRCRPESLSVYARFTRRGGIDINPYRTSDDAPAPANTRTARQ